MAKIIQLVGTSVSGKTTANQGIAERLQREGYEVVTLQEPWGSLRKIAKDYRLTAGKDPWLETAIFTTDRMMMYQTEVLPRLEEPNLVFTIARGLPDTFVYQGLKGGVDLSVIHQQNKTFPRSDVYLALVVEGEEGHRRAVARFEKTGETVSKNETPEAIDELAAHYRTLSSRFDNYHVIDTTRTTKDATLDLCWGHIVGIL